MSTLSGSALALCLPLLLIPAAALAQETPPSTAEAPEIVITVTQTANLRSLADAQGYDGHSPATFLFVVPAKTVILGKAGGGAGIDTGQWPQGVELALIVRGHVYGGGGNGADGGDTPMVRDGGRGGDALFVQAPIAIAITKTGSVKAGGGGGAGADGLGSGGDGGNAGQSGQSLSRPGGGEGFAIRTNGNAVVLDNKGQMIGQTG